MTRRLFCISLVWLSCVSSCTSPSTRKALQASGDIMKRRVALQKAQIDSLWSERFIRASVDFGIVKEGKYPPEWVAFYNDCRAIADMQHNADMLDAAYIVTVDQKLASDIGMFDTTAKGVAETLLPILPATTQPAKKGN